MRRAGMKWQANSYGSGVCSVVSYTCSDRDAASDCNPNGQCSNLLVVCHCHTTLPETESIVEKISAIFAFTVEERYVDE